MTRMLLRNFIQQGNSQNFGPVYDIGQGGTKDSCATSMGSSNSRIVKLKIKKRDESNCSSALDTSIRGANVQAKTEGEEVPPTGQILMRKVLEQQRKGVYDNKIKIQFNDTKKGYIGSAKRRADEMSK